MQPQWYSGMYGLFGVRFKVLGKVNNQNTPLAIKIKLSFCYSAKETGSSVILYILIRDIQSSGVRSVLCRFEISTKFSKIPFHSDSLQNSLRASPTVSVFFFNFPLN